MTKKEASIKARMHDILVDKYNDRLRDYNALLMKFKLSRNEVQRAAFASRLNEIYTKMQPIKRDIDSLKRELSISTGEL